MSKRAKYLEQMHILSMLIAYGPSTGRDLIPHLNAECHHDAFEALPDITPRGIGSKLSGLWTHGFVEGAERATFSTPTVYAITEKGRKAVRIFELEEAEAGIASELEVARHA